MMQSEVPESFRELCMRAQKESDVETVAEIVDRLLCALYENLQAPPDHGRSRWTEM
jgi:hypothetical protein